MTHEEVMEQDELLLIPEELAIAVNSGVDRAIAWANDNPGWPDTTYASMREKCIIESVSEAQLTKAKQHYEQKKGVVCPFCGEDDFDLPRLKNHLRSLYCEVYIETENV